MTIHCKICKHEVRSMVGGGNAQSHVLEQMTKHLTEQHKPEATELALIVAAMSTYLLLRRYVDIPVNETELRLTFERNEQSIFEILELNPTAQN